LISRCRMAGLRVCRCRRPRATPLISTSSFTTSGRVSAACFVCWGALTMPAAIRASVCGLGVGEDGRGRGDLWWWMSMSKLPRLQSSSTRHQSPPSCMVGKEINERSLSQGHVKQLKSTSDKLVAQGSGKERSRGYWCTHSKTHAIWSQAICLLCAMHSCTAVAPAVA
jgi:hypothetical protein